MITNCFDPTIFPSLSLSWCVCVCVTAACGVWQDSAEPSEEPSNLLCPVGSKHLLCHSGGTHLLPDPPNTGGGFPEQVQNTEHRTCIPNGLKLSASWKCDVCWMYNCAKNPNSQRDSLSAIIHGKWISTSFSLSTQQDRSLLLPYHQHGVWKSLCRRAFHQWEGNLHVSARLKKKKSHARQDVAAAECIYWKL